jgi:hypothetical protein
MVNGGLSPSNINRDASIHSMPHGLTATPLRRENRDFPRVAASARQHSIKNEFRVFVKFESMFRMRIAAAIGRARANTKFAG